MRFEIEQNFPVDADQVMDLYTDPAFYEADTDLGRIAVDEVLSRTEKGHLVELRIRYRFVADLPAAARAILDPARLTWVEGTRLDRATGSAEISITPDHYADRLQASARARFGDAGDGSTRTVSGDVKVRALLVGGQVERTIVDGMRDHLAEEAERAARRLTGQ